MQNSWYYFDKYLASCVVSLLMQRVAVNLKALLCHQNEVGNYFFRYLLHPKSRTWRACEYAL